MTTPDDRFAPPSGGDDQSADEPTIVTPVAPSATSASNVPPPPPAVGAPTSPPSAPQPPATPARSNGRTIVLSVLATLVAIGVVAAAFLAGRSGESAESTTTTSTSTTTPEPTTTTAPTTTSTTAAPAPEPPPPPAPIGDVRSAPAGLLCKDLAAQGYSYSAAVEYWRVNGQPNRMDADKNGIPCETVYSRADVVAYWPAATYSGSVSYGLPSGLLCRDLEARGVGVYDALRYYIWEGYPERMDADGNGIPCETVYPDAAGVWLYEF